MLAGSAAAAGFVTGTEDVPLMDGLVEAAEGGMAFDTPTGRVIEVLAAGALAPAAIAAFYAEALPQLGWRPGKGLTFEREGERLTITIQDRGTASTVRFLISPL